MKFSLVGGIASVALSAAASDQVGSSGTDLARCHVYYVGDYGACGVAATQQDVSGPCGDSPQNACISTTNGNLCPGDSLCNCGVCYKLTMTYDDGVQKTTYIVGFDTNGSETRYEMGQQAWKQLCPYVCQGYGNCAHDPSTCEYGVIPDDPGFTSASAPESCTVQSASVKWETVSCDGSGGNPTQSPTQSPYNPTQAPTQSPYYPTQAPTQSPTQAPTQSPYYPTQAPTPSGGGVSCAGVAPWDAYTTYSVAGTKVTYPEGGVNHLFQNQYWISGSPPVGGYGGWTDLGACASGTDTGNTGSPCAQPWSASQVYPDPNTKVSYQNKNWSNNWYTQGEVPGTSSVWANLGGCGGRL